MQNADDNVIFLSGDKLQEMIPTINRQLSSLVWKQELQIFGGQIQSHVVSHMIFSILFEPKISNTWGVMLTESLSWNMNMGEMVPSILSLIYKRIVRSHLESDDQILTTYNQQFLKKLDVVQHEAMLIMTGAMESTPIVILLSESEETNLETRRKLLSLKFTPKILCLLLHW